MGSSVSPTTAVAVPAGSTGARLSALQTSRTDQSPVAQGFVGLDGQWLYFNPAMCRLLGYTHEQLMAQTVWQLVYAHDRGDDRVLAEQMLSGVSPCYSFERRYLRGDGSLGWALTHVALVKGQDNEPVCYAVQATDLPNPRERTLELEGLSHQLGKRNQGLADALALAAAGQARYQALVDHLPDTVVYLYDRSHRVMVAMGAGVAERGFDPEKLVGQTPDDVLHPDDAAAVHRMLDSAFAGQPVTTEMTLKSSGRDQLVDVVAIDVAGGGPPFEVLLMARDITERRERERALAAAEARYSALIEHSSDVTTITDEDNRIIYASPAFRNLLGVPSDQVIGSDMTEMIHPDDLARVIRESAGVRTPGATVRLECRLRHVDGGWRHIELTATNRTDDPAVGGIVGNARDITERVQAAALLAHQATHDPLTDLPNRTLLLERLPRMLRVAMARHDSSAVLYVDLDHFKDINDSLGHTVGDEVLRAVGARLRAAMRPGDMVARLGGDEFVVVACISEPSLAVEIAERLRSAVIQPIQLGTETVSVGCSVGVAISDGQAAEDMIQQADTALYRAKANGRNRHEIYDHKMRAAARRRLDVEKTIRASIDAGEVIVLFQPIVDLASGLTVGTEALCRLRDAEGRMVGPDEFIPVAEDTGLIVPLGEAVLYQACAQQAKWSALPVGPRRVAVNLSPRQLVSASLVETVQAALADNRLPATQLTLELTESALIDAGEAVRTNIARLKEMGVTFALDDFGTGWSSLAYLRRFPVDVLKIDRSFVSGLGVDDDDTEVVRAIISLGHALRLVTVAEGVETTEHQALLVELGCDRAQGYLYGRPSVPGDIFPEP